MNHSVLTDDAVREIRRRAGNGERHPALAKEFGVARQTVQLVASGKTWRHLL